VKPYYQDGSVTIYHGDCREFIALGAIPRVDAVITSPPYNTLNPKAKPSGLHADRKSGQNEWMNKQGGYEDSMEEGAYQLWQKDCLRVFRGISSCVWINHKTRYRRGFGVHPITIYGGKDLFCEVVWNRGGSMALNCGRFSPSHEYWLCYGKPAHWDHSVNSMMSVWNIPPSRDETPHPCPFPVKLVQPIIKGCVRDRGVLDPFMGSGITLRAAKDLGRKAIGIEIEEKYCEIAAKRMAQEVLF